MFLLSKIYNQISKLIIKIDDLKTIKTINSRNLRFKIKSRNWITKYRANSFNDKEPEMLDWIDTNLSSNDIFFDIGANVGIYSIYAALRCASSKIHSFEPEFSNLDQLKFNIINNELQNNITPYSIGISNSNDISYLNLQDFTEGSALHSISKNNIQFTQTGHKVLWREGVAVFTLDTICKTLDIFPNLIKIDVDGDEYKILEGATNCLENNKLRSIIIEIDKDKLNLKKCSKILSNHKFKKINEFGENQIWSK
tara:strand:+ start:198 stop:959 length:762 start_codon:yes stop_codon:yes gene_type:complete